jgi:site-specific DNA-methyltransferase (adenine-specific)
MRWLCRLITPPGGLVLDAFGGSGSTAIACLEEGFDFVLLEQDAEFVATAEARIEAWKSQAAPKRVAVAPAKAKALRKTQAKPEPSPQLSLFDLSA